jgi:DNA repair protein RecO (recombination protein O)
MLEKTRGIILQNVKYGDKKIISKIYTLHRGLQSYAVNFSSSSKSKIRPAHLQPLNQVELEIFMKEKNEVHRITEIRISYPYSDLSTNIYKNCIAVFLNEMLCKTLKEAGGNESLFEFISWSLKELDKKESGFSSWHLYFLVELTQHLGFFPQNNFSATQCFFNIPDGRFDASPPPHSNYFDREDSASFSRLIAMYTQYDQSTTISYQERTRQLNLLIHYYRQHVPGFTDVKSLSVLQSTLQA